MVEYNPLSIASWVTDNLKEHNTFRDIHVVGQFDESTLLLSWSSRLSGLETLPADENAAVVTYIGMSDVRTGNVKVVIQFTGGVEIVFAALNQDLNVLAFVTESVNKETNKKCWQAYVRSCISGDPDTPCLALTDPHDTQIQLQFLFDSPDVQMATEGNVGASTQQMSVLVLIHKHSLQVHHFEMEKNQLIRLGSRSVLCLPFFWCQWIPAQQCLVFLHPWRSLSSTCTPPGKGYGPPPSDQDLMLSCVQFFHKGQFTTVFSIPADTFGIKDTLNLDCIDDEFYLNKISLARLNLEVILWREGNVCICYQPYCGDFSDEGRSNSTLLETEESDPLYYVTLLHHGVQFTALRDRVSDHTFWPICFAMIQDHQLLVLSAGGPAHIIDTDPSHRTGFQIFIPEYFWPSNLQGNVSVVSMPNVDGGSSILLNCQPKLAGVSLALNQDELVSLFCSTQVTTNRKNILHFFATHVHDVNGLKKILSALSHDVWSSETRELLTEYLLGSTYAKLKKSGISCHPILYHLPLSERNETECEWLKMSFLCPSLDLDSLISQPNPCNNSGWSSPAAESGHREGLGDFWHWLWHHQVALNRRHITDPDATGFRMDSLAFVLEGVLNENMPVEALTSESPVVTKAPIGFADLCSLCMRNKPASSLSLPPDISHVASDNFLPFPPVKDDLVQREKICSMIWSKLRTYLQQCCPLSSSVMVNKICSDYILAQLHQSNVLCSLLFSIFGITVDDEKQKYNFLRTMESSRLQRLHSLLERFFVSCRSWAFPLPPGFRAVMALTAYSTMHFLMFMQHVQLDAVKLQYESVLHLVQVLDDETENLKRKLNLIGYLPKEDGEAVLRRWNQPIGDKYRARRRARELLTANDSSPDVHQVCEHDTEQSGIVSVDAEFAVEA